MQQSYHEDLAFKQMRRQAEKEEEEAFRKKIMAKMAEDDRLEQMNAQKRRMKQLEHKREVERLMEDRRRQREAAMVQTTLYVHNYSQKKVIFLMVGNTFPGLTTKKSKNVKHL